MNHRANPGCEDVTGYPAPAPNLALEPISAHDPDGCTCRIGIDYRN